MKKLLYPLLLLFSSTLSGQNWMPVVPGDLYHFRAQDSNFITHTIRIDSVKKVGPDSVFYLNRVVVVKNIELDIIVVANGKAQFLGSAMVKKPTGDLNLVFEDDDAPFTLTLLPNAATGSTWEAVADSNLTATVISTETGVVLGESDSLKTIQFSNGQVWILSKNHGLVQGGSIFSAETTHLTGIETRSLGERLLYFEDFYNFNLGDIYEWQFDDSGIGGFNFRTEKWLILDKQVLPDTFRYRIERRRKSVYNDGISSGNAYHTDTLWSTFPEKYFEFSSAYNKQSLSLPPLDFYNASTYAVLFEQGKKVGNKPSLPGTQLQCAIFPGASNFTAYYIASEWGECCDIECEGRHYYEEYRVGLGRVQYIWDLGDVREYDRLLGAVIQGDTVWGQISPDWFFTATQSPQNVQPLTITPNPAGDFIQFSAFEMEGDIQVALTDLSGKVMIKADMNAMNNPQMDISRLSPGIYFVQLLHKNRVWTGKFQKVN